MSDDLTLKIGAVLGAGTEKTFSALRKGFQDLAKWLQSAAKEQLKLQNVDVADALGHTAMGVKNLASSFGTLLPKEQEATKEAQLLARANEEFANKTKLVQQAWALFTKEISNGTLSIAEAYKRTLAYDKAMQQLEGDIKLVGGSYKDLNTGISLSKVRLLEQTGALKLSASGFTSMKDAAYQALITDGKLRQEVKKLHQDFSTYNKELQRSAGMSAQYTQAVQTLGKAVNYSDQQFKTLLPVLKNVENGIQKLIIAEKTVGNETKWLESIDRAKVTLSALDGNLKVTATGFTILNSKGLRPFGILTLDTANKLGILDASYTKFLSKLTQFEAVSGLSSKAMQYLRTNLENSGKSFSTLSAQMDTYISKARSISTVKDQIATLALRYKDLLSTSSKYSTEAQRLFAILAKNPEKINQIKIQLAQLNSTMVTAKRESETYTKNLQNLQTRFALLLKSESAYSSQAQTAITAYRTKNKTYTETKNKLTELNSAYKQSLKVVQTYTKDSTILNRAIEKLGRSFVIYARYVAAAGVIQAFTSSMRDAGTAVIEYDQTLKDLQAILNATDAELSLMDDTMIAVAKDTKFSLTEIGEVMKKLGQSGFTAVESVGAVRDIAELSTGTLTDMTETVRLVTSTIRSYGMEVSQTGEVVDIFANAVNNSRITIEELNTSMNYIGPIAKSSGLSLRDTSAALGLLADAGIRASTRATGLRRVLGILLKPTDAFAKAVEAAGFTLDDFNPLTQEFSSIIAKLPSVIGDAGDAIELFGLRGSTVATALAQQGAPAFTKLKDSLTETGAAARMAATQSEGLVNIFTRIKQKVGVLAQALGSGGLTEIVRGVALGLEGLLTAAISLANTFAGKLIVTVMAATTAFLAFQAAAQLTVLTKLPGLLALIVNNFASLLLGMKSTLTTTALLNGGTNALSMSFARLGIGIKSVKKSMSAFIATGFGKMFAGAAIFATAYGVALNRLNAHMKTIAKEQLLLSSSLNTLEGHVQKTIGAFEKYGQGTSQAKDALASLDHFLEKLKKDHEELTGPIDSVLTRIDKERGVFIGGAEAAKAFSDALSMELTDRLIENAQKIADTYNNYDKLFSLWRSAKRIAWNALFPSDETLKSTNTFLGWIGKSATSAYSKVLEFAGVRKPLTDMDKAVENAVGSFRDMEEAAKDNEASATALSTMKDTADVLAKSLLKDRDASLLTKEEIKKLVFESGKWDNNVPLQGALYKNLLETAKQALKTRDAFTEVIAGYAKLKQKEDSTFADRENYLKNSLNNTKNIIAQEVELQNRRYEQEKLSFVTSLEAQKMNREEFFKAALSMEEEHQAKIKQVSESETETKIRILRTLESEYKTHYAALYTDIDNYYISIKNKADTHYKLADEAAKAAYDKQLQRIQESSGSENTLAVESLKAKQAYYAELTKNAEEHFKEIEKVLMKERDVRLKLTDGLSENEETLSTEIIEINRKTLEEQKKLFEDRKTAYTSMLSSLLAEEQKLTAEIKKESEARVNFNSGIEEKLFNLKKKLMSDEQAYSAEMARADKLRSQASEAARTGEFDKAKKLAEESISLYERLAGSLDEESMSTSAYASAVYGLQSKIKSSANVWNDVSEAAEKSMVDQKKSVAEMISSLEKSINQTNDVVKNLSDALTKVGSDNFDLDTAAALKKLSDVQAQIQALTELAPEVNFQITGTGSSKKMISEKLSEIKESIKTLADTVDPEINFIFQTEEGLLLSEALSDIKEKISAFDSDDVTPEVVFSLVDSEGALAIDSLVEISDKLLELSDGDYATSLTLNDSAGDGGTTILKYLEEALLALEGIVASDFLINVALNDTEGTLTKDIEALQEQLNALVKSPYVITLTLVDVRNIITSLNDVATALSDLAASAKDPQDQLDEVIDRLKEIKKLGTVKSKVEVSVTGLEKLDTIIAKLVRIQNLSKSVDISVSARTSGTRFATGGTVQEFPQLNSSVVNQGAGYDDDVKALLTRGEFVMKRSAVKKYGIGFMNAINAGKAGVQKFFEGGAVAVKNAFTIPKFASGGSVDDYAFSLVRIQGKAAATNMAKSYSSGVRSVNSGGDSRPSQAQISQQISAISSIYDKKITLLSNTGELELSYILKREKADLAQLAAELQQALQKLEVEHKRALQSLKENHDQTLEALEEEYVDAKIAAEAEAEAIDAENVSTGGKNNTVYAGTSRKTSGTARYNSETMGPIGDSSTRNSRYNAYKNYLSSIASGSSAQRRAFISGSLEKWKIMERAQVSSVSSGSPSLLKTAKPYEYIKSSSGPSAAAEAFAAYDEREKLRKAALGYNTGGLVQKFSVGGYAVPASGSTSTLKKLLAEIRTNYLNTVAEENRDYNQAVKEENEDYTFDKQDLHSSNDFEKADIKLNAAYDYETTKQNLESEIQNLKLELEEAIFELRSQGSGYNTGGFVNMLAGAKRGVDSVRAMLTPGEFVVQEKVVNWLGKDFLEKLNNFQMPKLGFSAGGLVPGSAPASPKVQDTLLGTVNLQVGKSVYPMKTDINLAKKLLKEFKQMGMTLA